MYMCVCAGKGKFIPLSARSNYAQQVSGFDMSYLKKKKKKKT